jgi:integrase/predicted RNA-binding Zn-ribbon protein involved in translation (DUF1610 family)
VTEVVTAPVCPDCGSERFYRDGVRRLADGTEKQRYICRQCGYRFSAQPLSISNSNTVGIQICAKSVKNLDPAVELKYIAGDARLNAETKGLLVRFCQHLEKEGYSQYNMYPQQLRSLVAHGANLLDPESVKATIAKLTYVNRQGETVPFKNGTKMLCCAAYDAFAKMIGIKWDKPRYKQEEIEVYVPYESELDALINGSRSRIMAAYLQTLKETFADPSEALRIRWKDIDWKHQTIAINYPVKGHRTGTVEVSAKLLSMLSALPKKSERVFPYTYKSLAHAYWKLRKRIAAIQQNPRILAVELRGFRHWGGTMIAYITNGNVLEVMRRLRHKNVDSTMKYIGRIQFKTSEFDTTSATTEEEILRLGSEGWTEYSVMKFNDREIHFFKRPRRFGSHV